MLRNIVLVGFMGSGKSSVGRRLSQMTGFRFVDTDEMATSDAGMPITEIFAKHGEEYFRELESRQIAGLEGQVCMVLATGGGIVLREQNRTLLKRLGAVAWLHATPDILFERVSRTSKRPLLHTDNPRETFDRLLASRLSLYEQAADFSIDSSTMTHERAAHAVLEGMRQLQKTPG